MKSLILDCLSQSDSISEVVLSSFIEKLNNYGSTVKTHTIRDLEINPCFACTAQYTYKYGDKCRCDDDMNNLLPDFKEHNNWIFVSRIDRNGGLEYLKNVLDRMEPLFQPISFLNNGFESVSSADMKINGNIMLIGLLESKPDEFAHNVISNIESTALLFNKNYAATIFVDVNNFEKFSHELSEKVPFLFQKIGKIIEEEAVA